MRQFAARAAEFAEHGVEFVRVFHSDADALRSFAEGEHAVPFPVLADREKRVYALYGVESSRWRMLLALISRAALRRYREARRAGLRPKMRDAMHDGWASYPADFLISSDAKILRVHHGRDWADSLSPEALHTWLDELN